MPAFFSQLFYRAKPYLLLLLAAIVAYLPVSTMAFALKNDIVALEYPINYFISESLRSGVAPLWFNTWAMGFPLESILTWSVFSPVRILFGLLLPYSLYLLHIEFIFFIAFSGWSFYYFLKSQRAAGYKPALLISVCYMLSGFLCGSSQWLLYITAAAFLPLLLARFLLLLKAPGWKNAALFAAVFYLHLTSVYVAFTIIACYLLLAILGLKGWRLYRQKTPLAAAEKQAGFLLASGGLIGLLAAPCLYGSLQVLQAIERGQPIAEGSAFFQSNYLHPQGLQSLLLPLSLTKIALPNTEGTMMNSYVGLLPLLLLPLGLGNAWRERNSTAFGSLAVAVLFLLVSLGHYTPLREWLNRLPGFAYFRNPGLFRIYFIFFFLVFLFLALDKGLAVTAAAQKKTVRVTSMVLGLLLLAALAYSLPLNVAPANQSLKAFIQSLSYHHTLLFGATIQLFLLGALLLAWLKRKMTLFAFIVFADVVLNTLLCTPFFTVSSYSVQQTIEIFQPVNGFPVQATPPVQVPAHYQQGQAQWHNVNVYRKQVSLQEAYRGPLVLKHFAQPGTALLSFRQRPLLSAVGGQAAVVVQVQKPNYIRAMVETDQPAALRLLQNWYPGWKAFFNSKEIALQPHKGPGMQIHIPHSGVVEFRYSKNGLLFIAIGINLLLFSGLFVLVFIRLRKRYLSTGNRR